MRVLARPLVGLFLISALAGCISSDGPTTDNVGTDSAAKLGYLIPETITGMEQLMQLDFTAFGGEDFRISGNGVWLHEDKLYVSGSSFAIVDVTDAANPVVLSVLESRGARDVDIMEHPNGNLYAVLAGSPGIVLVDVTDPLAPFEAGNITIGFHNIAVVPGTALVYNSRSVYRGQDLATEGGLLDIVDFTDVANATVTQFRFGHEATVAGGAVKPVTAPACHDVAIYTDVNRAYCAGITETHIWDITDPKAPTIIQIVENPGTNIHHAAYAAKDHNLLIIGDELGGAALAPGCAVSDQPYGGVWFVDISDLTTPVPVGYWAPEEPRSDPVRPNTNWMPGNGLPASVPTCTAHFGNLVEDRDILTMGFYTAGVFLIDFSDPADPVEIANYRPGGNVWEGVYYRGHVYTGDSSRGVDVLKVVGDGEEWISLVAEADDTPEGDASA